MDRTRSFSRAARLRACIVLFGLGLMAVLPIRGFSQAIPDEDGYELWLRYRMVEDARLLETYRSQIGNVTVAGSSETVEIIRAELNSGLDGLIGVDRAGALELLVGTPGSSALIAALGWIEALREVGDEGYLIRTVPAGDRDRVVIAANTDIGLLYGAFHLLRLVQTHASLTPLQITEAPRVRVRVLNHWDNLDRTVERGYSGASLWDWQKLPDYADPRYTDYARANASIGINGTVLTNVNGNAVALTTVWLKKVAALADVFRPYGIRVYLTARFNAPMEIGGLETADPLHPAVRAWWNEKADEIYDHIPDFGGFIVKANSEGQPGPQDYGRTHADGANMLAEALGTERGIVMWRAFVYSAEVPVDRALQAYNEFKPLDGTFAPNVLIQVKNGAIDFQPREPFHPLFGAMPETPLMLELQITREYLGLATSLAYLGPLFEEVLQSDTQVNGPGSTVAKVVDGSLHAYSITGMAGVSNIGSDRNWCGAVMACANWYAFGRMAWNPEARADAIATDWLRMTFTNDTAFVEPVHAMLMASREATVDYMTPLGLHHIMARGHHWGPGPWVTGGRPDWTSLYYHRADSMGIGFDRSAMGSNAVAQYAPVLASQFGSVETVPESLLLWFHHVPWTHTMASGRTLWDEMSLRYQRGVDTVDGWIPVWDSVAHHIDGRRANEISSFMHTEANEARWWRDACLAYFGTFSGMPLPAGVDPPVYSLEHYQAIEHRFVPGN